MEQERLTHIRMADSTLAPVEYLTDESQQPEYVRKLSKSAWEAGQAARKRLLSKGIPVAYLEGKNLVRLYPDGHVEIIKENLIP